MLKKFLNLYADDIIDKLFSGKILFFIITIALLSEVLFHTSIFTQFISIIILLILLLLSFCKFFYKIPFKNIKVMILCHLSLFLLGISLFLLGSLFIYTLSFVGNYLYNLDYVMFFSNIFWIILIFHITLSFFLAWILEFFYLLLLDLSDNFLNSRFIQEALDSIKNLLVKIFPKMKPSEEELKEKNIKVEKRLTYNRLSEIFGINFIIIGIIIVTNSNLYIQYLLQKSKSLYLINQENINLYKEILSENFDLYKQIIVIAFALFMFRYFYLKFKNSQSFIHRVNEK